jgi:hypothetical protein
MKTFSQWLLTEGSTQVLGRILSKDSLGNYRRQLKLVMPAGKVKHSLRVGATLAKTGGSENTIKAALFHDFLERGGSVGAMTHVLGLDPHVANLVVAMSSDEKESDSSYENEPLNHIRQILGGKLDDETKNQIILIKLSDRIDNLKRRVKAGGIGNNYIRKSKELCKFLFQHYTGDKESILILRRRLVATTVTLHQPCGFVSSHPVSSKYDQTTKSSSSKVVHIY